MTSEADRQAFLHRMGLTSADIADPDSLPHRTSPQSQSLPNVAASKVLPSHSYSSVSESSVEGLSYCTSLGNDGALPPRRTPPSTLRENSIQLMGDVSPFSSSLKPYGAVLRSVHWKEEAPVGRQQSTPQPMRGHAQSSQAAAAAVSEEMKERGNRAFEAGEFREAVEQYTAAIENLMADSSFNASGVALLAALHSNRSAAYLQAAHELANAEDAYGRALCDADRTVALRSSWFKGYARQGDVYFKLRRYGSAAEAYEMALRLDPHNHTLTNALTESRQRAKQMAREEMEMRRTKRSTMHTNNSSLTSTGNGEMRGSWERDPSVSQSSPCEGALLSASMNSRTSLCPSGQAQQLWTRLKHEVEATVHEATGDAYRLQQLERFRNRSTHASSQSTPRQDEGFGGPSAGGHRTCDAPSEFATAEKKPTPKSQPIQARSRTPTSTTEGGLVAVVASFDGPVHNARDVPYEFSSAAASAYQQKLLETFRQRKAAQK